MDGKQFDQITQGLTSGASRRQIFGGLLGGAAALLTGASVLEAKKGGKGKAKGKGKRKNKRNKGRGRPKVQFCHRRKKGQDYTLISVGGPSVKAHRKHGDEQCVPEVCQVADSCDPQGLCLYRNADDDTPCVIEEGSGTCQDGACVLEETEE